ncbi:hypothetical protein DFH08DRAFT_974111 [Mycena albidolilacea]|uniref:Uncharacterized protein n=1 Tax=Mycena albidolilacea TaxID=1033008 RepID=A0AAD6Z7H6_9AGAR|nr:hypothetical protein DFH08DRAFT_974111 [Mycena albidolilacea]
MAAASTRRARPVLSPRRCCAFSPCAARPIPLHPRRPPPMPVLCAGVPSPRCHTALYLLRPTFHMQLPPLFASPASMPTSSPRVRPFSPRTMHVTPAPTLTLPLFHTPVLSHRSAAPSPHARSAPHAAATRPRAPTAASTSTTPYPLPSPAALPAPAAARTTSPPSSLAAVLPPHLMNIYANPILHATSPRRRLPAGALPDCIQHHSCTQPQVGTSVPYVRLTRAETYTPPLAAGHTCLRWGCITRTNTRTTPVPGQVQDTACKRWLHLLTPSIRHARGLHHTAVDAWLADHALAHTARCPPALVRTSATSTDGTFKPLHRRTMTLMLEPEPTPVFHLLHLRPSRIRPLLSVVTYNKVSVLPPPSTNRIVGLDMRAPSSLTFGLRSSKASGEDTATLRAHTGGLPPVFTCHSRNHSSLLPDAPSLKSSQGSAHGMPLARAWDGRGDGCHSTSPSHYNIPKPAATLPGPLPHPPARKASTTPTVLTVFPTFAHTCP